MRSRATTGDLPAELAGIRLVAQQAVRSAEAGEPPRASASRDALA
jgi:hypothetical protein